MSYGRVLLIGNCSFSNSKSELLHNHGYDLTFLLKFYDKDKFIEDYRC